MWSEKGWCRTPTLTLLITESKIGDLIAVVWREVGVILNGETRRHMYENILVSFVGLCRSFRCCCCRMLILNIRCLEVPDQYNGILVEVSYVSTTWTFPFEPVGCVS